MFPENFIEIDKGMLNLYMLWKWHFSRIFGHFYTFKNYFLDSEGQLEETLGYMSNIFEYRITKTKMVEIGHPLC